MNKENQLPGKYCDGEGNNPAKDASINGKSNANKEFCDAATQIPPPK